MLIQHDVTQKMLRKKHFHTHTITHLSLAHIIYRVHWLAHVMEIDTASTHVTITYMYLMRLTDLQVHAHKQSVN